MMLLIILLPQAQQRKEVGAVRDPMRSMQQQGMTVKLGPAARASVLWCETPQNKGTATSMENKRDTKHNGQEKRPASRVRSIIGLARWLQARVCVVGNGAEDK